MSENRTAQPSRDPAIPDKLYFRIGEVAHLLGVETHTLRFWETEFPQLKVGKGGTGQRLYRRRDVELVFEIKHLLYEQGYTIPGARQLLQGRQRAKAAPTLAPTEREPRPEARQAGAREPRLERIRSELRDLSALLTDGEPRPPAADQASATNRARASSAAPRGGLHLTPRPASRRGEAGKPPSLFDPPAE